MTDMNKSIIGKDCYVDVDGERQRGEIVDVVESLTSDKIILYCVRLPKRKRKFPHMRYDVGRREVELV